MRGLVWPTAILANEIIYGNNLDGPTLGKICPHKYHTSWAHVVYELLLARRRREKKKLKKKERKLHVTKCSERSYSWWRATATAPLSIDLRQRFFFFFIFLFVSVILSHPILISVLASGIAVIDIRKQYVLCITQFKNIITCILYSVVGTRCTYATLPRSHTPVLYAYTSAANLVGKSNISDVAFASFVLPIERESSCI